MEMYLKGPCRGAAVVVDTMEANIDMIDADHPKARDILDARKVATPDRPIILLSLQNLQLDNTYFIKKPVNVEQILAVLDKIKAVAKARKANAESAKISQTPPKPVDLPEQPKVALPEKVAIDVYVNKSKATKPVDSPEQHKAGKHQSAMQLNEGGFTAFLGTLSNVDFDDETQLLTACYDPRQYFLGYVMSAYKTANLQSRVLQLCSIWKPLTIFPENQEIWVDADDKQTRAFAGMPLVKGSVSNMVLTAVDAAIPIQRAEDKFQDMSAFIWKLAIWTSKGRFPIGLDIQRPVFLERWPNFTRLVITPDALRIAALLIQAPRTPLEVASLLHVKPQYVFVFISACQAIGILKQSERQVDTVIAVAQTKKPKNEGLLSKILNKLRGA
ncbi:hypothetical protein A1342_01380 [Methylomonas methanica]|uniref:Response regulatory domain-containing protein n=2 Tax=Methylomonas TaxID=416 RepID=A0A140E6L3_9GAMM|nr:hypothetical protein JT25_021555 [Methylomonas denitrificans]OAI00200.1 hypothetical protein A1342_01380 [Methylomonas methanica]